MPSRKESESAVMDRFTVKKIADYFRVVRINPQGGRTIVSSHRTEKSARSAMLKLSQSERQARIKRTVLCFEGEEYEMKPC